MSTFTNPKATDSDTPDDVPNPHTRDWILNPKTLIVFIIVLATFYLARSFLLPVFAALLLAYTLIPFVRRMVAIRIPRTIASFILVAALVSSVVYLAILLIGPAFQWLERAPRDLGRIAEMVNIISEPVERVNAATEQIEEMTESESGNTGEVVVSVKEPSLAQLILNQTPTFLGGCISTVVLLYFLLAFGDVLLDRFADLSPDARNRQKVVNTARSVEQGVSRYLLTVTTINICLGAVIATALHFTGFQSPLLWGVIAAVFNFVPYLGAIVGVTFISLASFATQDTLSQALLYPSIYLFCTLVEGNFITPIILGRYFTINPIFIVLVLLLLGWLWGIVGAVMAVPMLVIAKELAEHNKKTRELAYLLQGEKSK